MKTNQTKFDWKSTTWEGNRREQLNLWASMSFDDILDAQEEMAELSADMVRQGTSRPNPPTGPLSNPSAPKKPSSCVPAGESPRDLRLTGCTPEPLMTYLKALGILRLVSEQRDSTARGWWKNDTFWLQSSLNRVALLKFFLEEYEPTPIVAPWAGGSGFFSKDNKTAVDALSQARSSRVRGYADVIRCVRFIIKDERIGDKPRDRDKDRLIQRFRRELPDGVITWMDAVMVLQQAGQSFAPLLGTGGNDGRLDFAQNFMQRLISLNLHRRCSAHENSRAWLEQALFGAPATLVKASVGQFAPGRAGGPNATQGMEGDSLDNPWDFILMIEGTLLFASAAVRRFGLGGSGRAAFPFTVRPVAAGFDSAAPTDEAKSRGELWLPLWKRPTGAGELRQLFGEGRAEVSGRAARNGTDFARAVAGLGVDRGVVQFNRFAFLKRSGKAFLASPLGRFEVATRFGVDVLREIDPWLARFRRACGDNNAPGRFGAALHRVDSAIFNFCKYGGAPSFVEILVALGEAERELATSEHFRSEKNLQPLVGLSPAWIEAADDGSMEFALARALASVYDDEAKICPIRANLEPVDWGNGCRTWAQSCHGVAWNAANLATNMVDVLHRRLIEGAHAGCVRLPLASRFEVTLETVAAFAAGELDDERIEKLLWGLLSVNDRRDRNRAVRRQSHSRGGAILPRAYALLKLLFLPRPLVIQEGEDGVPAARLSRNLQEEEVTIRPEPSILHLLRGGRAGEACAIAMQRLRASGLAPMPTPIRGRHVRDYEWEELNSHVGEPSRPAPGSSVRNQHRGRSWGGFGSLRLAASLLIPIEERAVNRLVQLVIRNSKANDEERGQPATSDPEGGML